MKSRAFTLIELLIVVAIIAILAAIAVPNFLEAQVRSKVSRTKSDMRTTATALEAYRVDNNAYPQCHPFGIAASLNGWDPNAGPYNINTLGILERLSTPIAYVTSALIVDPFNVAFRVTGAGGLAISQAPPIRVDPSTDPAGRLNSYIYQSWNTNSRADATSAIRAQAWLLHSAGPDQTYHNLGGVLANERDMDGPIHLIYDPTNGTVSFGSIYRTSGNFLGGTPSYAAGEGLIKAVNTQR